MIAAMPATPPALPDRRRWLLAGATSPAWLAGCAAPAGPSRADAALADSDWARATRIHGAQPDGPWLHRRYGNRRATDYRPTAHQGRAAVHAHSASGNSLMRLPLPPTDLPPGTRLDFSWWVPALLPQADLREAQGDDAVARVILSFGGEREEWTRRDHMLSELAHLVMGEPMPDATLMYVWDHRYPVGTVADNPHTRRVRKLVVQQGDAALKRWVEHSRDVHADFLAAFGRAPGPLTGIGLMTDTNNLGATAHAWYGPLSLRRAELTAG